MTAAVLDVGQGQSVLIRLGTTTPWWTAAGTDRTTPGTRQRTAFRGWGGTGWICWCSPTSTTTTPTACPSCWSGCRCPPSPCRTWRRTAPLRREILTLAEEKGIPLWWVRRDTTVELEKGQLTLYPPLGAGEANELGLSVLAGAGGLDLLVTGDMSGDVEGMLVEHAGLRDVELLVAGHHGSASSTSQAPAERPSAGDCHPLSGAGQRLRAPGPGDAGTAGARGCGDLSHRPGRHRDCEDPVSVQRKDGGNAMPPKQKADTAGYQQLKKDLAGGEPGRLYLSTGEETYLRDHYLGRLKELLLTGGMGEFNLHTIPAREMSPRRLEEAVDCLPMMAPPDPGAGTGF